MTLVISTYTTKPGTFPSIYQGPLCPWKYSRNYMKAFRHKHFQIPASLHSWSLIGVGSIYQNIYSASWDSCRVHNDSIHLTMNHDNPHDVSPKVCEWGQWKCSLKWCIGTRWKLRKIILSIHSLWEKLYEEMDVQKLLSRSQVLLVREALWLGQWKALGGDYSQVKSRKYSHQEWWNG